MPHREICEWLGWGHHGNKHPSWLPVMAIAAGIVDGPTLSTFYIWLLTWSQPVRGGITDTMSCVIGYNCSPRHWYLKWVALTHWGLVTHICISKLTTIDSDNGLSPSRCQAIIWTNAGILLIWTLGANFIEIIIKIHTFSLGKCFWKCCLENSAHLVSASMC